MTTFWGLGKCINEEERVLYLYKFDLYQTTEQNGQA